MNMQKEIAATDYGLAVRGGTRRGVAAVTDGNGNDAVGPLREGLGHRLANRGPLLHKIANADRIGFRSVVVRAVGKSEECIRIVIGQSAVGDSSCGRRYRWLHLRS